MVRPRRSSDLSLVDVTQAAAMTALTKQVADGASTRDDGRRGDGCRTSDRRGDGDKKNPNRKACMPQMQIAPVAQRGKLPGIQMQLSQTLGRMEECAQIG